jgi:hypothetical protein
MGQREMLKGKIGWVVASIACLVGAVAAATGRNWGATIVLVLFFVGTVVMVLRSD